MPVKAVLEMFARGESETEILKNHPELEVEDLRACLELASEFVVHPFRESSD